MRLVLRQIVFRQIVIQFKLLLLPLPRFLPLQLILQVFAKDKILHFLQQFPQLVELILGYKQVVLVHLVQLHKVQLLIKQLVFIVLA
jgi:hypothetical protein